MGLLCDHGENALVRVIGTGRASSASESAVEAFETAGGAQMPSLPGRELLLDEVVGDGGSEVSAQGGDSLGLRVTVLADDLQIATEDRVVALGLPDGMEVFEDGFAMSAALFGGEVLWYLNGLVKVALFVEETALLPRTEVDGAESRAQATAAIVEDELQSILASNALLFQDTEKSNPLLIILAATYLPEQNLGAVALRPNPHGYKDRALEAALDRSSAAFAVTTHLPIRA
jgi:hypothetical protein